MFAASSRPSQINAKFPHGTRRRTKKHFRFLKAHGQAKRSYFDTQDTATIAIGGRIHGSTCRLLSVPTVRNADEKSIVRFVPARHTSAGCGNLNYTSRSPENVRARPLIQFITPKYGPYPSHDNDSRQHLTDANEDGPQVALEKSNDDCSDSCVSMCWAAG